MRIGVTRATVGKMSMTRGRNGLVVSLLGAKGGYRLPRPHAEISVAQIIGAMDGPIGMTECTAMPGLCAQESACTVRANWQTINQIVLDALQRITLEQMTKPIPRTMPVDAIRRRPTRAMV